VGLQSARKAVFSGIHWQRCQFHLQQNASQYVPRQGMKREVAADIRAIFNAPDRAQTEIQLHKTVEKYAQSASKLADWLEGNITEGLTFFSFPEDTGAGSAPSTAWSECAWKSVVDPEWLASFPMKLLV